MNIVFEIIVFYLLGLTLLAYVVYRNEETAENDFWRKCKRVPAKVVGNNWSNPEKNKHQAIVMIGDKKYVTNTYKKSHGPIEKGKNIYVYLENTRSYVGFDEVRVATANPDDAKENTGTVFFCITGVLCIVTYLTVGLWILCSRGIL